MLTVFWSSTSYTVIILLWKMLMEPVIAPARWWPCTCLKCVSGLRRLENPRFFWDDSCHWPGAKIWFRHKRRKLVPAYLLLHCIDGYSCLRYWNEFLSAVFQALDWSFLLLHFDGNVCHWIPKVIWPRMDWFWDICWKMVSFVDVISVWSEVCKKCSIFILFDVNFFRCLVWGVFWSVL